MKALFTLPPAIKRLLVWFSLVSVANMFFPHLTFAADLQANGQDKPLVFEVKNPNTNTQENQISSLNFNSLLKNDPLVIGLRQYLEAHDSPLAEYAEEIVQQPQWQRALAVSYVESNMGIHCMNNNCSGIGVAPGHPSWRKYPTKLDWFKDMCQLLEKPIYKEKYTTFRQMKGIYVYPGSESWVFGAQRTFNQLKEIEQQANQQRLAQSMVGSQVVASLSGGVELADLK